MIVTLKNKVLSAQGIKQGMYQISHVINGKQSWISGSNAIWYEHGDWTIGDLDDIGSSMSVIYAFDAYGGLDDDKNDWQYYNPGHGWMLANANDVSIKCTSKN